jgi:hypothetical protein
LLANDPLRKGMTTKRTPGPASTSTRRHPETCRNVVVTVRIDDHGTTMGGLFAVTSVSPVTSRVTRTAAYRRRAPGARAWSATQSSAPGVDWASTPYRSFARRTSDGATTSGTQTNAARPTSRTAATVVLSATASGAPARRGTIDATATRITERAIPRRRCRISGSGGVAMPLRIGGGSCSRKSVRAGASTLD